MKKCWLLLFCLFCLPLSADISCPIDSSCITCSGDVTTALTNALNGEERVILSSGSCTFSGQQTWDSDTQIIGAGSDATTLTYTGSTSPAFAGCVADSAFGFVYGLQLVLQNAVEGFCIEGFSNTSMMRDVHIDGGTVGVRLQKSGSDGSSAWVGTMVDMEFSNQSSHAIVLESGNQHLALIRSILTSCGDHCISLENPTHFHSSIQVIGGSCAPDAGSECIEFLGGGTTDRNTPLTVADVSWTPADTNQDFVTTNSDNAAVTLVDIEHSSCAAGNLLLDKPTAGNDVACDGANQQKVLPRVDGLADVSNMTAGELSDFQSWLDNYVYAPLNISLQSFTSGYTMAENCACTGDIESCIEDAWAAGDLTVYVGTGGNSGTGCTVGQVNFVNGARLVGRGIGRSAGGGGEGSWINATGSGPGFVMNDIDDWQLTGLKIGHTNSAQDVVEVTDFCDTCLMSRIDTRSGDSHIVFEENPSGVAASGGLIMAWLSFNHGGPIYQVNSVNGQFQHSVITPDIGRGSGDHYDINDVDPTTSSFLRMGGVQQMGTSGPNVANISSSGALPILDLGGMPVSIASGETIYLADSDISITLLGLGYTTNPATPIEADFLLNESGTADDIDPAADPDHFIISKFDELVVPAGGPSDTTPPTPGNSGTITTDQVTSSGFRANWTKATDDTSAQGALQYSIYSSTTNNIGTVADAKNNGMLQLNWTTDIATHTLTGLNPSTLYWVNVLVRDESMNEAAYTQTSETTSAATGPSVETTGTVTLEGLTF